MVPVVDVSIYQGVIDFDVMASRGVKGVIIRVANGNVFDKMFGVNCPRAQAAGLEVGGYTFVNPKNASGAAAGGLLASVHNDHGLSLPPMLDIEGYTRESGNLPYITGAPYAAWIREMAAVVEAGARKPIFYCNASYWNPTVNDATFGGYDCIVARYPFYSPSAGANNVPPVDASKWGDWIMTATSSRPQVPMGWDTWDGWQFSAEFNGRARVYGATQGSDLDLNIIRDDAWARWTNNHVPDIPTPKPTPAPFPQPSTPPHPGANTMIRVLTVNDLAGQGVWLFDPSTGFHHMSPVLDASFNGRLTDINMGRAAVAEACALYGFPVPSELA